MSSLQNGMRPERTSSMAPWYSPRQASAKAGQSSVKPSGLSIASASRAIELRQSTRVPNTSKNRAFTATVMECSERDRRHDAKTSAEKLAGKRQTEPTMPDQKIAELL